MHDISQKIMLPKENSNYMLNLFFPSANIFQVLKKKTCYFIDDKTTFQMRIFLEFRAHCNQISFGDKKAQKILKGNKGHTCNSNFG